MFYLKNWTKLQKFHLFLFASFNWTCYAFADEKAWLVFFYIWARQGPANFPNLFQENYFLLITYFLLFFVFFQNEKNCFLVKFQVKLTKIYKSLYLLNWGLLSVLLSASKKVIQYGNLLRLNKNKNKHTLKAAQQNKHVKLILFLIKIFWFFFFFFITLRKIP